MVSKLKLLVALVLLVGTAGLLPGAAAEQRTVLVADGSIVDPEVWRELMAAADRTVVFRVETESAEAEALEVPLHALQGSGSVHSFENLYGQDAIIVSGSGHAVRFLAAWPSVTRIALADEEDDRKNFDGIQAQNTLGVQAAGAFAGTVTLAGAGTPLEGIRVRGYRQTGPTTWDLAATVLTGADGTYTADGLDSGIYRARFDDPAGDHVPQYYDNRDSFEAATSFDVDEGETRTGIDAALELGGHIVGTVTSAEDGEPVKDIVVSAWRSTNGSWESAGSAVSGDDGTYDIGGLPAGTYRVRFSDPSSPPVYVSEVYDDASSLDDGTDVSVTAGETTSGIDAALGETGRIAGAVTAAEGGDPLADIVVSAWYSTTVGWQHAGSAVTADDGTYDLGGLPPEAYRVRFADASSPPDYVSEVYEDASSLDDGTDVRVTAGETTSGIDAALVKYGRVTGSVYGEDGTTPLEGIYADVYAWNAESLSWERASRGITDATGAYEAGELDTGDYRVQFSDPTGQYATEVYDDQDALDSGDDVHVELGEETANIDAELDPGPTEFEVFLPLVLR